MRRIAAVITDVLGQRVVIGEDELQNHLQKHLFVPKTTALELIELVLKDPTVIYEEVDKHIYHLFYKLETGRFLVVVVKRKGEGSFFTSIYTTGKTIRNRHKKLKKVKS